MRTYKIKGHKFRMLAASPIKPRAKPRRTKLVVKAWCFFIRLFMRLGYTVCLNGRPASGKSYILGNLLPGQIIDARPALIENNWKSPVPFSLYGVKHGAVGIDETAYFCTESLKENAKNLKNRKLVFTTQRLESALDFATTIGCSKLLIIYFEKPFLVECHIAHILQGDSK
ncbi:hypothetical protein IFG57_003976 [Salmonella enterica]|nr:hypothetical protein [Salmonella enterica]